MGTVIFERELLVWRFLPAGLVPDYSPETEKQLLLRIAQGEEAAFGKLFRAYYPGLLRFIARLDKNPAQVDEVIQETFIRVWISRDQLPDIINFRAWLFTIASRESIALIRRNLLKQKVNQEFSINTPLLHPETPAEITQASELKALIAEAIRRMPEARRRIYRMSREEGLKPSEIAARLNLSVQTVKNTLVTALRDIRTFLSRHGLLWIMVLIPEIFH